MSNKPFVKETVFGSKAERAVYKALNTRWGDKFHLFPSLPFANVINFERMNLTHKEMEFLFKTSVDFTLCDKETYRPFLSIDFDGMGRGFSRNGEYVEILPSEDKYRKLKFNLKLKITEQAHYDYFIVSYRETENLDPNLHLTIVDGIIGKILARNNLNKILQERGEELNRMIEDLSPFIEKEVIIDDWFIEREIETEAEYNPIFRKELELEEELHKNGVIIGGKRYEPINERSIPISIFDHDFENRIGILREPTWIGWKVTLNWVKIGREEAIREYSYNEGIKIKLNNKTIRFRPEELKSVEKSILIRNIGLFSASLSLDIAEVLALNEIRKLEGITN